MALNPKVNAIHKSYRKRSHEEKRRGEERTV
jgi:hypothetical protein